MAGTARSASLIIESNPGPGSVAPGQLISLTFWIEPYDFIHSVQIGGTLINGAGPFVTFAPPFIAISDDQAVFHPPWNVYSKDDPSWGDFVFLAGQPVNVTQLEALGLDTRGGTAFQIGRVRFTAGSHPGPILLSLPPQELTPGTTSFACYDLGGECDIDVHPGDVLETGLVVVEEPRALLCSALILLLLLSRRRLVSSGRV